MNPDPLGFIFLDAAIINNFVLAAFLGICPFLGVSAKLKTAVPMGFAVIFVMTVAAVCTYAVNQLLVYLDVPYLRIIAYIAVIASTVQLVEMVIKWFSETLFRSLGIFLPLITTNCAIMGMALFATAREYGFMQTVVYGVGAGVGFMLALVLMAGLREQLELSDVPSVARGAALTLLIAGILSMAFMGFAGLGS